MLYPSNTFLYGDGYIKNNLVVNLDAGNRNSYTGLDTTWYDLTGRGNNANLVNGISYIDECNGYFRSDGINDHIEIPNSPDLDFPGDFTLEFVFNKLILPFSSYDELGGWYGIGTLFRRNNNGYSLPGAWSFETNGNSGSCSIWEGPGANFGRVLFSGGTHIRRNWNHIIWTRTGTTMQMYQNGKLCYTGTESYDLSSEYNIYICKWNDWSFMTNEVMLFRIYQKGFNAQEVITNYNFIKPRFNHKQSNIAKNLEKKHYSYAGPSNKLSAAKYPTDETIGTTRILYTKSLSDFKDQIDFFKDTSGTSSTIQNLSIANNKKAFVSNVNQENINNVINQLDYINKEANRLYKDILNIKSGSISKDGIYPSSKYR